MQSWWILGQRFSFMLCIFLPTWSLQNLAFWRSEWWHRFLCIKPISPVVNGGFVNQDFDWNVMPEESMLGLWLLPGSLEELGLTFKASESPLEKSLVKSLLCDLWQPFQGRNEGCFLERWLGGTIRHNGNLKDLREASAIGEVRWQVCGLASVPWRVD